MGSFDANRNGVPDFLEGMMDTSNQTTTMEHSHAMSASRVPTPISSSPTIEPEATSGWTVALLAIAILGVCAFGAVGAWYFFLR